MKSSKRKFAWLAALALVLASVPARAQVTGQYTGAQVLAPGAHLFGGYLDVSSNVVGLMAQLRLSFYPGVEFGFQGGPARNDDTGSSRGTVRLGTDVRFATMEVAKGAPFDLALGGELATENGDNYSVRLARADRRAEPRRAQERIGWHHALRRTRDSLLEHRRGLDAATPMSRFRCGSAPNSAPRPPRAWWPRCRSA